MTDRRSAAATASTTAPDVDVTVLLGDGYETFERVLTGAAAGPLAVVGDPFAGRETVLDAAADRLDADRIRLDPEGDLDARFPVDGDAPVVVDDCQHLYTQRIGGFEPLDRFLDWLARVDRPVVTGWNRYAWAYLTATRGLDRAVPAHVELQPVEAGAVAALVRRRYRTTPRFRLDEPGTDRVVELRRRTVDWRDRTWSVPYPVLDLSALRGSRRGDVSPKDAVFERLAAVSGGNLGVATALWEQHDGAAIRPSDIVAPGTDLTLDREAAFCLRLVLAKESVTRAELADVVGPGVDRILARLARDDLVRRDGSLVSLRPAALRRVVRETERGRIG